METERTKRWFLFGAPSKKAGGAGSSSTTGARSTAPPACSDGFYNVDGSPECRVYIQMRRIEQVRVWRSLERRGGPLGIALVTANNVGQNVSFVDLLAGLKHFGCATSGAYLGRRINKYLHVCVRKDDGPDVATIENRAGRAPAELTLEINERRPHLGYRRYHGSRLVDVLALERPLIESRRIERAGHLGGCRDVIEPLAGDLQIMGNRAVDQSGVEMPKPEVSRKALAQGALAGSCRPIDGDDHQAPDDFFTKGK